MTGLTPDRSVLVIGAGTMGRGIAEVAATAGYSVTLVDQSEQQTRRAMATIEQSLSRRSDAGRLPPDERDRILGCLRVGADLDAALPGADVVIEAVFEDVATKTAVLKRATTLAPPTAIIASNTSALSVTELAAAAGTPERIVGMHFFNPPPKMRLVEIVRGLDTSVEAVDAVVDLTSAFGKTPVVVRESPGFAVTRINALIGNEAFYMLMEGVASAREIDTALKLGLNHPMGPFELGDLVGWDIRLKVLEHLHESFGEKFRPCPLLRQYVAAGRLGRKTGAGVFEYDHADRAASAA